MSNPNRSESAFSAVLAHATYAGLPKDADTEAKIAELLKGLRLLCTEYNVDFYSASLLSPEQIDSQESLSDDEKGVQKYIAGGGSVCVKCGSYDITGDFFNADAGSANQPVHCQECGHEWVDIYTLSNVEQ